jgi:hypothetical protein
VPRQPASLEQIFSIHCTVANRISCELTLDQEFPFDIPIRAAKIDAEGFEAEVLKGADRLFRSRCIDFVIIEAVQEVAGNSWPALLGAIAKLEEYGYEPHIFVRDGAIQRTNLQSIG